VHNIELYEQLIAERKARFQVVDRIRQRLPELAEEEVIQDPEMQTAVLGITAVAL
jgi:hypothetical protein